MIIYGIILAIAVVIIIVQMRECYIMKLIDKNDRYERYMGKYIDLLLWNRYVVYIHLFEEDEWINEEYTQWLFSNTLQCNQWTLNGDPREN